MSKAEDEARAQLDAYKRELDADEREEARLLACPSRSRFLASLKWREGPAPSNRHGNFFSRPLVMEIRRSEDAEIVFVGDQNYATGVCDDCSGYGPENATRWAYLWEEDA